MPKKEAVKEEEPEDVVGEVEEPQEPTGPQNLISPSQVASIWESQDPLDDLFKIYTLFFNPTLSDDYDTVDDNKIKLLAEFQLYNLIFCKNDLKYLDDTQISEVLELIWSLLAINQDGTIMDHSVIAEGELQKALTSKFEELKIALIDKAKAGVLSKDQIKSIMTFMKSGYFKHFRLIDFVLRNRQQSTWKQIKLFHNSTLSAPCLDDAKEIIDQPLQVEGEGQDIDAEGEEDIDPNKDPLDGLDNRLDKVDLNDEEKSKVKEELENYNKEANAKAVD
eukprot:CAMPEP_0197005768 /NCGR_PEP_ID=MMETSP1380-20130617/31197_1 /TAXON_ID=5936 /ORGANISM="Euplotes crassus, Strain CT5" /LENGTH=277 /DNA_ID=CAMNT_0042425033 /DNA_START=17 /DNA_END=851 /DNA_ORIENTATION=+